MHRAELAMQRRQLARGKADKERCSRWFAIWMTATGIRPFPAKPAGQ